MPEPKVIKVKSMEDLVNIIVAAQVPLVHHLEIENRHIYFLPFIGVGDLGMMYYIERKEPLKGKYIVYNKFNGEIDTSNKVSSDARLTYVPIIEVESQNAFSRKLFKVKGKKKKKKKKKDSEEEH